MEIFTLNTWLIIVAFIVGYAFITLEHVTKINKATVALMMGIVCWAILFTTDFCLEGKNTSCFLEHLANISQVVLFLLGALAIVEIINIHHGFTIISQFINISSKRNLLWVIAILSFFLSSILDNLTTTIVMITLLSKLTPRSEDRLVVGGAIVIAANAGGAWTPIGDVTTTMLWIGGQVTAANVMMQLFLPSIACLIAALIPLTLSLKGSFATTHVQETQKLEPFGRGVLWLGVFVLVFVPVFKSITGLPPFMGVLFGVSLLWIVTDLVHRNFHDREHLRMPKALSRVDLSSTLFFLGILLCIDALDAAGILDHLALWFDNAVGNYTLIAIGIGLVSAVVDNVPLVAASIGMYDLTHFPTDSKFWQLIAYCAGTGGSILIIGSAAGVVYMGLEKVDFFWYIKRIGFAALVGYFAGIGVYLLI